MERAEAGAKSGSGGLIYAVIGAALVWIAAAAFWATPGPYTSDDVVYQAMIDSFAREGSFFVSNGIEEYGSPSLRLPMMLIVDGQLVPRYPSGWGILAAPAYLAGGLRGVILTNALASVLTLAMIWFATKALFQDRRLAAVAALIYALATFAVDYALAIWPHSASTFLVTAAFAATAQGWRGTTSDELRAQLVSGLALGIALNLRVDAVLATGGIVIWQMCVARRPFAGLVLFTIGLAPGVIGAAAINYTKFESLSPITYGKSIGSAALSHHVPSLPLIAAGGLALLGLGLPRVRAVVLRPSVLAAIFVAMLAVIVAIPSLRALALRIAEGIYVLVIDFQAHPLESSRMGMMHGRGLHVMDDGTTRIFGVIKKALLQSLPYAAAVLVLLPRLARGPDRAAIALCLLFMLPFMAFFAINMWHGGVGGNMRYFLMFLPVLAIVSALSWREVAMLHAGPSVASHAAVLGIGISALSYALAKGYPFTFALQNTLPNAVAAGIAIASVLVIATRGEMRARSAAALRGLFTLGLMLAFTSAWFIDLQISMGRRATSAEMLKLTADLPDDALVATYSPETAGFRLNRPPALTAQADFSTRDIDPALSSLVSRALAEGRPVFAQGRDLAEAMAAAGVASIHGQRYGIEQRHDLYEMAPPEKRPAQGP